MMNKCIGTIAYLGGIPALLEEFVWSWTNMICWNHEYLVGPGEYVHYDRAKVSVHDVARNILAKSMRGDWLVMFDTDHAFEPDLVARLLRVSEDTGADVVASFYLQKHHPHAPVLYHKTSDGLHQIGNWDRGVKALEISSAGGGGLLVKRKVFEQIELELHEEPFGRIMGYGEDHSFFLRLAKLNIKAVCDPGVECHHLQIRALEAKDYDQDAVSLEEPAMVGGYC